MTRLRLFLLGFATLTLAACGGGPTSGATCPTTQSLSYTNFGKSFFDNWCITCHKGSAAPKGYDFSTLSAIRDAAGDIDAQAAAGPAQTNRRMPPQATGPSDEERRKLGEWLACGAP